MFDSMYVSGIVHFVLPCFILVSSSLGDTATCDDMDTDACKLLHVKNPDICEISSVADTACRRFCGRCRMYTVFTIFIYLL